jgi:TPR repeat protein
MIKVSPKITWLIAIALLTLLSASAKEDIAEIRAKAARGEIDAQIELGHAYEVGEGLAQNYGEALKWYRKAADQGDDVAQFDVGVMYYRALGVPQDLEKAVKWYRRAALQGNADAQFGLAAFYYAGAGVPKDEIESLAWFDLSALSGLKEATENRDLMERALGPEKSRTARLRSMEIQQSIKKEPNPESCVTRSRHTTLVEQAPGKPETTGNKGN